MYGVDFHKAENSLIVVTAEFEVRQRSGHPKMYGYVAGPNNTVLQEMDDAGNWSVIAEQNGEAAVESILPRDFGLKWTWREFIIALSFWAEGNKAGYYSRER